jgi:hypothetical protein
MDQIREESYAQGPSVESMDEAEQVDSVIALPGGHHNLGAGRRWHFLTIIVWVLNGLTYVAFLFATGEWRRLIPTSSSVFPEAWQSLLTLCVLSDSTGKRLPTMPSSN